MKKYIVGNLKMNLTAGHEVAQYISIIQKEADFEKSEAQLILCVPYVHLERFCEAFPKDEVVKIGAQNFHPEQKGSFTGEVSVAMLKEIGVKYSIIGHSERRKYFCENNETSGLKIKAALKNGIIPIYCLGETAQERELGLMKKIITEQLHGGLFGISSLNVERIILVYEPVWSVGTDEVPSVNDLMTVRVLIRRILTEIYGERVAQKVAILYGGSVTVKLMQQVCIDPKMDGVLVGRESLLPRELVKMVKILNS